MIVFNFYVNTYSVVAIMRDDGGPDLLYSNTLFSAFQKYALVL